MLTVRELCAILAVSKQTLYRLINDGELVPTRVSRSPRFAPSEVRRYLENARHGGDA